MTALNMAVYWTDDRPSPATRYALLVALLVWLALFGGCLWGVMG